MQARSAFTRM